MHNCVLHFVHLFGISEHAILPLKVVTIAKSNHPDGCAEERSAAGGAGDERNSCESRREVRVRGLWRR